MSSCQTPISPFGRVYPSLLSLVVDAIRKLSDTTLTATFSSVKRRKVLGEADRFLAARRARWAATACGSHVTGFGEENELFLCKKSRFLPSQLS